MATPKLRFKEFDGDWANFNLGDISDIKTGPFGSTLHQKDYVEIGTPIITVEHLGEVGLTSQNLPLVSDEDKVRLKSYMLDEGDLAFSRVGSVDRCAIITDKEKGWLFSGRILRVRPNKKLVHSKNLMYALKTEDAKYRIRSVAVGQTMPSLNTEILKNFSINLSNSVEEQTKIASFLSVVDEKISQLTQKHELLSQYKQGMMQKLFSQQIRFKADDGSEFGEWEEKTIQYFLDQNYIFDQMDGNHGELYPKSEEFSDSGIPYIGATDFSNGTVNFLSCKKIPLERAIKFKKGIAKNGDVLFAHNATVGPVALLMTNLEFVILSTTATYYRCNPKKLINTYLKSVLESDYFKKQYVGIMSQSTRNQVPITTQRKLNLVVPCLEEQTKIANFLSAIDQKIEVVAQQIEQAKTWKKGLLQQMFV